MAYIPNREERGQLLTIRLLGTPEASVDGVPIEVDTRKAIALLAYLAVEGQATRDLVSTLFWAESSTERARATLRRTLSSLRTGVGGDSITADRNIMTLKAAIVDLAEFDLEVGATETHSHPPSDVCDRCIPHLNRAAGLYRGDFMEGFYIRDAPGYEDWSRNVTETYRLRASEVFHRLAVALAAAGDYAGATAAARRWIELDELHEPAHRQLMLLNAWAGDRPGAIEAYSKFVAVLDRELGVAPLEETTELYEAILDEDLPPAPGLRRSIRADIAEAPRPDDLLDRLTQLQELDNALAASRTSGGVVAVTGRAWMGKTRLIEESATRAAKSGYQVLIGRSFRMEQGLPYGVVSQLLRSAAVPIAGIRDTIPEWALIEASRIDPSLSPGPHQQDDRLGELRLFEAVHQVIAAVAAKSPTVIVIDDVQWVDVASAGVISYLAKRIEILPVLMILARRGDDDVDESIRDVLASALVVHLGPLTATDIQDRVNGDDASSIVERTGGVPLLVLESIEGGDVEDDSITRYMELRLAEVSELAGQVLSTAAVLTGICTPSLLRVTSGRGELEIVEAVEELIGAGLLREIPENDGLSFTLDALEKVAYDSMTLIRRRLLHKRAAEALADSPRSRTDVRIAAAAAAQFRGAGDARAAEWYHLAAQLAVEVYANAEARTFLEAALALDVAGSETGSLHLGLGELAMVNGDYGLAIKELTTAAAQAEGTTLGIAEHRLGEVRRLVGQFDIAVEHFERSAAIHPRPADVFADWALLLHRQGDVEGSLAMARRALGAAEQSDDKSGRSRAHNIFGVISVDPSQAMNHIDIALDLAGDDEIAAMAALNNKAHLLHQIGNDDAAVRMVQQAIDIAARTGHRHREAALRNHLADLYHRSGRREMSEQEQTKAMAVFADIETEGWQPEVWLLSRW